MTGSCWSLMSAVEKRKTAAALYESGLSYERIAHRLDAPSRNAVSGAISRHRQDTGYVPARKSRGSPRIKARQTGKRGRPTAEKQTPAPPAPPPEKIVTITRAAAWDPLPGVEPVRLVDCTSRHCRWPIELDDRDDFHICGAPTLPGRVYCASHHHLATRSSLSDEEL